MKSKIKRYLRKIIGWSAITLVALILVLITMLTLVDATVYRGPLQAGFSALMGRSVRFEGEMSIKPSLRPWFVIENVHIANPAWASRRDFAHADRLEIQVALWPLLTGDLKILNLVLEGGDILLETSADGRDNWSFTEKSDQPTTLPDIESLSWNRSVLGFRLGPDPAYRLAIAEASATLTENELIQFNASVAHQGANFTISLLGGRPSAFVASDKPWPVKLALKMPGTVFELEGSILRPFEGKGLDLQISVTGEQIEDLSSVLDVTLPALGPYAFSGRLTEADNRYSITNFSGQFSGTDAVGRLALTRGTGSVPVDAPIELILDGAYSDVPFKIVFEGGSLAELIAPTRPWPVRLEAVAANASVLVEGSVVEPLTWDDFDITLAVSAKEIGDLGPLVNTELPALGDFALSARVTAINEDYTVTNLAGYLGQVKAKNHLAIKTGEVSLAHGKPVSLKVEGDIGDVPFTVSFQGGSLDELITPTRPWPVELEAVAANASVLVEGSVVAPLTWDDFDITLAASAKEIGDLGPLVNTELPALGDFALSARVTAINEDYTVTNLAGYLGQVKAKNHLAIKTGEVSLAHGKPVSLKVQGSFGDVPFRVSLDGGTLAELMTPPGQWPIRMNVVIAGATLDMSGTTAWSVEGKELDLEVNVRGQHLSALEPLLGIGVPSLGSYQLSGRVNYDDNGYTVTDFKAAIAGTDVAGLLALSRKGTRPQISAKLVSGTLNLENLIPADATDSSEDREPVWLDSPLPTAIFRDIDADIEIAVKNLVGAPTAIHDLSITAELEDGRLTLAPIALTLPAGQIKGRAWLDASTDNPHFGIDLTADQFDLDKIKALANVKELRAGSNDLQIHLATRGKTFRELLQGTNFQLTTAAVDLRYRTQIAGRVVPIRLSRVAISTDPGQPINIALEGTLRGLPFSLRYVGDRLVNLATARESWPVALSGQVAGLTFETKGEVIQPFGDEDFDLSFTFTGENLAALDPLLDIDMPTRGPYRLSGRIVETDNIYRLAELDLSLEDDHATGSLTLNIDGPRPGIVAKFTIDEFHLEDAIEELIEEEEGEVDDKRLFSDFAIPVDALRAAEVDFELLVTRVLGHVTDLGEISVKLKLENGHLIVSPMQAVLAGGQITSSLDLDVRSTLPLVSLHIAVKDLDYGRLLFALDYKDVEGEGDIEINLTSQGATLHDLLGRANGKAEFVSEAGKFGRGDIDLWAADLVTTMLSPKWALEKYTEFNCLVARFDVTDGVAQASSFLLDTKRITIAASGTLDLGTERLNMKLTPAPKKASFISLATPVQVTGTLVEPKVTVTGKSKATSFSKILLPFVNPYFLLYSGNLGGSQNPCEAAIAGDKIPPTEEFR